MRRNIDPKPPIPQEVERACAVLSDDKGGFKAWLVGRVGGEFYIGDYLASDDTRKLILREDLHGLAVEYGRTRLRDVAEKYGIRSP